MKLHSFWVKVDTIVISMQFFLWGNMISPQHFLSRSPQAFLHNFSSGLYKWSTMIFVPGEVLLDLPRASEIHDLLSDATACISGESWFQKLLHLFLQIPLSFHNFVNAVAQIRPVHREQGQGQPLSLPLYISVINSWYQHDYRRKKSVVKFQLITRNFRFHTWVLDVNKNCQDCS